MGIKTGIEMALLAWSSGHDEMSMIYDGMVL
jgi:hypothetical protein